MKFYQRKLFRGGIPFFIFVIGSSFALTIVTDIRYMLLERKNNAGITPDQKKKILFNYARERENPKPLQEVIGKKTLETWKGDPTVKAALEDLINNPLKRKELDAKDPEYQKRLEKLKDISKRKHFSLEDEYREMRDKDINNWENKRIPRPYKENDEAEND